MKSLQSLYVSVVIALGFVIFGSFASQVYFACQQRDILHNKADTGQFFALPPINDFIGSAGWEPSGNGAQPLPVNELWKAPVHYVAAVVSGLPLALRIATLLMILGFSLAILLLPRLPVISRICHSFDSLFIMSVAWGVSLFGYVFTWVDYNNLAAQTNSPLRTIPFDQGVGISLTENALSRISVGILITSFSVLLVCRIMSDVVRTYQRWRKVEQTGRLIFGPTLRAEAMLGRLSGGRTVRYRRRGGRRSGGYLM